MERKIAIYMRSSLEQDEKSRNANNPDESDTIANQRKYLYKAALTKGFERERIVEYADDGHTGTNFDRPSFQRMMEDVENGRIEAVLVKDFSRLGRDYIGVGEYVEQVFPMNGVRIISVNDNWDSAEHPGETLELDASFRTMIYEMYSRDLSIKRISANQARNKNGIYISSEVPYGYKKIPGDPHSLFIDDKCAPVVKKIFGLYLSGEGIGNIAKILSEEGVPTPAISKQDVHDYSNTTADPGNWTTTAVGRMLRNEMYTGTLVLNRWKVKEFKSDVSVKRDPSEWMRFPNNHEAIISADDFRKVQKRLGKRRTVGDVCKEKKLYPLYCGHCKGKLSATTRNEDTFICNHGNRAPYDPCGQIEIRRDKLEEALLKAVNSQARLFLENEKKYGSLDKRIRVLESRRKCLSKEKDGYHDERMALYRKYKEGRLDKDAFLKKKGDVLKREEECLSELDAVECELVTERQKSESAREMADAFRGYDIMSEYNCDIVNSLISRVDVKNDGTIKIVWNFESELPEENTEKTGEICDTKNDSKRPFVAVYSSDMFLMPQEESSDMMKRVTSEYATEVLKVDPPGIVSFYDSKDDENLFFREGYMRFIDAGRSGASDVLLIRCFKDLYLSNQQLSDLMRWVIPKLPCRFISVEDGFDSAEATEGERMEIYEKYKGVRKGDQMKYRAWERQQGLRKPKEFIQCTKLYGYYPHEDGCCAVPEVLRIIKEMYRLSKEHHDLKPAVQWLNGSGIPTSKAFFLAHGYQMGAERNPVWNKEKVWGVIKQEGYAVYCRHYERCRELGRHCERSPIVDRETFDEVNKYCRYRDR